jgi:predicted Zn-dependent peptidase
MRKANEREKKSTPSIWTDKDDAPELTESFFDKADLYAGKTLKARGRPKSAEQLATSYLRKGKLKRTSKHYEADIEALKKASKALDKLLEAKAVDVESMVADFKTARKKVRSPSKKSRV